MAYNPQEWASGRQSVESRPRRDVYGEPLHTPPPPYPEQRNSTILRQGAFASPSTSLNTSPVTQHAAVTTEPANYVRGSRTNGTQPAVRQSYDTRRATRMSTSSGPEYVPAPAYQHYTSQQANSNQQSSLSFQMQTGHNVDTSVLPPPPRTTPPNILTTAEIDAAARLSNTRRSTSAGPTTTAGPSASRSTRTLSSGAFQDLSDWSSAVPIPGPPPGPPPPSSRSRSAGREIEYEQHGPRQRPPRLYIRNSNLETIPATPATLPAESAARQTMFPLRIDTGSTSAHGKAPAVTAATDSRDDVQASRTGTSALARRAALRGPGARASTQPRSRSRSMSRKSESNEVPPSSTFSTNPWASALEQAKSPQDETLPESSVLPATESSNLTNGTNALRSHTPPITPGLMSKQSSVEQHHSVQQAKVLPTPPLSQKPLLSANSVGTGLQPQTEFEGNVDAFLNEARQRHTEFLKREQEASTDLERLRLFTSYMQQESLIRKERYSNAFKSAEFDVQAAQNMLFHGPRVRRASAREVNIASSTEQSPAAVSAESQSRNDAGWWKEYRPALSPIASMDYDEQSSRGRAPSRWWESATGSQSDGHSQGVARSKRESKYMSLSKKLFQSMENEMQPVYEDAPWSEQYPDEKANPDTFGFYEDEVVSPPLTVQSQRHLTNPSMLDISRFVTLPPPYPRHFPAVNNSHPDLAEYRSTVRALSDLNDAKSRQSRHNSSVEAMRVDRQKKIAENRKTFRTSIQSQIAEGSISYAEAAEAEKIMRAGENEVDRQGLQAEFDTLQDVVINPLHDQLNERIERLSNSLQSLQRELFASAANQDPDQPVQEGDDVPELLEQLTQLKWLFEAREILHQELFNLLTQRNDAYKAIVALPYHQSGNLDKIRDTDAFFEKDAATRHATYCAEALRRHESFLRFIEDNALRGVEMQSSAFWDITPGLVDLLQKIPADLTTLEIRIPEQELKENPSYDEHPLQYLYLLLRHAQRSSYQYIEGQINLHCLVHEVKTGSLAAHYRASKAQQKMAGDQSIDLANARREDEGELTQELKNRATLIEEQWQDALGKQLTGVKERVKKQLQKRGAWDAVEVETEGG